MKSVLVVCAFLLVGIVPNLNASRVQDQTNYYQQGTILKVENHKVGFPQYSGGSNPSDAPLQSTFYAYDVSVRVDCETYVGHYESVIDYLPTPLAANQTIRVHITKHFLYFGLPLGGEMKMAIGHVKNARGPSCEATQAQQ
jgi:hypothetical protein